MPKRTLDSELIDDLDLPDEELDVDYHEQENIPTLIIPKEGEQSKKQVFFRHAEYGLDITIKGYEGVYQRINETSVIDRLGQIIPMARQAIVTYV